jgi:hypothetical protein
MREIPLFVTSLFFEVGINIDELYRDDDFYIQAFWWFMLLALVCVVFIRGFYLNLKQKA